MLRKLVCTLFLTSLLAAASEPTEGTMANTCLPSAGIRFDLAGSNPLHLLYAYGTGYVLKPHTQIPVEVLTCTAAGRCSYTEQDVKATIVFDAIHKREATGDYTIFQPDGSKQQGSFKVVRKKQPKPFLCE